MRRQAEYNARKAKERAIREETKRLERAQEEERRKRHRTRERMRAADARELYDTRWKALLAPASSVDTQEPTLRLSDVPWPIYLAYPAGKSHQPTVLRSEDFTVDTISSFLLPTPEEDIDSDALRRDRRERLREAMLRFHPDKFEGRVMPRVQSDEREIVREVVGVVARTLNTLMAQTK